MDTVELFMTGNSQAVRLPEKYRFDGDSVYVKGVGKGVLLLPFDAPWQILLDSLDRFTDDFMQERHQPPSQERENPLG